MRTQKLLKLRIARRKETLRLFKLQWYVRKRTGILPNAYNVILYKLSGKGQAYYYIHWGGYSFK